MKRTALLFALLCLSIAPIGCSSPSRPQDAPGGVALVENGKSDYVIVTAANASPSEKHAAAELQRFIREISGAELPIVTDAGNLQEHEIILGQNAHLKPAGVEIDFTKLGNEGFTIRTSDERLIIAGSALRGTICWPR
jgi:alpha-glucuronidase